jgi:hypothetical protein
MTSATPAIQRRTGAAALAASVLLVLAVGPELLWPVQRSDGSVTDPVVFTLYLISWTLGAGALTVALLGLGRVGPGPLPRAGRLGRGLCLAGAVLLAAFGPVGLVTALLGGAPAEESFLLFAVGMLLFLPGAIAFALGLRRSGSPTGIWVPMLVAAGGVVAALVVSADPWHDLGLLTFHAAWAAVGLRLLVGARDRRDLVPTG